MGEMSIRDELRLGGEYAMSSLLLWLSSAAAVGGAGGIGIDCIGIVLIGIAISTVPSRISAARE